MRRCRVAHFCSLLLFLVVLLQIPAFELGSLLPKEVSTIDICFVWEEDSYYGTFQRVAAAVDLGIAHSNRLILPKTHRMQYTYINAGNSCITKMYSAIQSLQNHFQAGLNCTAFLGASKRSIFEEISKSGDFLRTKSDKQPPGNNIKNCWCVVFC